ncbi:MAG: pyridoxamine 5'-phosphate oxidase family protein [Nitriliruptoraceae bacterium]
MTSTPDDHATDRHGLEVLSLAQCLTLLRSRPVGRLAYIDAGEPTVVTVNFLVDGSSVVMRSLSGAKLDIAVVGEPVAFQLDDHDPVRRTGWSVLVRGVAMLVDDVEAIERYAQELDSWAVHDPASATWIRIVADEVSGRRIGDHDATVTDRVD